MQRRPLDPLPYNEDDFLNPLERLASIFLNKSNENSDVLCVQPLIFFENYNRLFQMIGFNEIPVHPKIRKKILFPEIPPEGEHPTGFLQFGAEIRRKSHVIFEIGDHSRLVRFDFKENYRESRDELFYQLDELQLWDGGVRFDLDCEDESHVIYCKLISKMIANCVGLMLQGFYSDAKESFMALDDVVRHLHNLSDEHEAQHNAEWMQVEADARRSRKQNTP